LQFNGKPYSKNYISHFDIQKGASMNYVMSSRPNKKRGITAADLPYSFSADKANADIIRQAKTVQEKKVSFNEEDSLHKDGYTLIIKNYDPSFDPAEKQKLINTFFEVYPQQAKAYNANTLKRITFVIDPNYNGVAETGDGVARYSSHWLKKNPEDIDVVTHEVMHVVQAYPNESGPGWLTEGIADYVRYKYGVNNEKAGWSLTPFKATQSYTNSYRITARFLVWLEKNIKPGIVNQLDAAMRSKTYTPGLWMDLTGKSLDELWVAYAGNPVI
jgi:hypothetical protein